jgi:hypothetical protein
VFSGSKSFLLKEDEKMKEEHGITPPTCPYCKKPLTRIIEYRDEYQQFWWNETSKRYVGGKEKCYKASRFCPSCNEDITSTNADEYFLENC